MQKKVFSYNKVCSKFSDVNKKFLMLKKDESFIKVKTLITMEVIDYQEFIAQDFLAINSQNFSIDTATLIGNEGTTFDRSLVSMSERQIANFLSSHTETNQFNNNQDNFIDTFSTRSPRFLPLGNEKTYFNSSWSNSSRQTEDILMSGFKIGAQVDTLTGTNLVSGSTLNLLKNSGFDKPLDGTNWLIGKTGKVKEYDRNVEKVAYITKVAGQGRQMYLKLPQEAQINYQDQLSLFQDISGLKTDKVYAVEARVKWLNPENNLPSAIVSFWAKNPDNSFRGKDFVITDGNGYKKLRFEFTPSQIGTTRFFLGLFTHINGNTDDTEIYVDDYKVTEIGDVPKTLDPRQGNLLGDGGFNQYTAEPTAKLFTQGGWNYTVESSVAGLEQSVVLADGNKKLRLELPKAQQSSSQFNTSVTGVYQNVELVGGQTYQLSADFQRISFDQFSAQPNSIVQFIAYRKSNNGEDLFLGPIDVPLSGNGLLSKNFQIVAPESGNYTILVRLAGWGNEGNGVVVDVDNVSLVVK